MMAAAGVVAVGVSAVAVTFAVLVGLGWRVRAGSVSVGGGGAVKRVWWFWCAWA